MDNRANILITGGSGFIGTHLVERLIDLGHSVVNLDLRPPQKPSQMPHWVPADIKDVRATRLIFQQHAPTSVIHLAAKTNLEGETLADFPDNVEGTRCIVESVKLTPSVRRLIVTSTQYVLRPGVVPRSDTHYDPYTMYGASKVETERIARAVDPPCTWVIVRPTNVWGPRHPTFPGGLWRYIAKRQYFHPGRSCIPKAYAYVRNVAEWLTRLLTAPSSAIHRKMFYLADGLRDSRTWMDDLSLRLTGRPVLVIPRWLWSTMARVGDGVGRFGLSVPLNSDRLFRMTTPDVVTGAEILALLGPGPISYEAALDETVTWLLSSS